MTQESVNQEPVSTTEPVSTEGEKPPETETTEKEQSQEQPFSKAQEIELKLMIANATALAEKQGVETGRRQMQGIKDKEVAEAQREARFAQGRAKSYETQFQGLDDETKRDFETARLRGENQFYQQQQQDEVSRQQQEAYTRRIGDSLNAHLEMLGIDPNDKRVDWAQDESDPIAGRAKFDASVAKIVKENAVKEAKDLETRLIAKMEADNLKNRIDMGLESHDTSTSAGVEGEKGDEQKLKDRYPTMK